MKNRLRPFWVALPLLVSFAASPEQPLQYPPARVADVVDNYHGVRVADPYRWLEDPDSEETIRWVEAQNALTRSLLDRPERQEIRERLSRLFDYPRSSVPIKRANRYFFTRNSGLQNQPVLYVQEGLQGETRLLLDPNLLSPDGTVALTSLNPSRDGKLLAYALSRSGSDRQEIYVMNVDTGKDLTDKLLWAKFASVSWTPDHRGFYYTRFPEPGTVPKGDENYFNKVYYHRLGDAQSRDDLVFERPSEKEAILATEITRDGRFLVLTAFKGSADESEVYVLDRTEAQPKSIPLFTGFKSAFLYAEELDGRFYFQTDAEAPRGRVIAVDIEAARRRAGGDAPFSEVIPESADKLSSIILVNRRIVAERLQNASSRLQTYSLEGKEERPIELPALGSITSLSAERDDQELLFGFTSFTQPQTSYRYDFLSGKLSEFERATAGLDPQAHESKQVWYPSKDGTRISMFIIARRDIALDGRRPVLLTGYGGFNIPLTPAFDPTDSLWLERGGVIAVPNLRGGGEYGESWHRAGMLERKQNVFDDFIAAAEWLIGNRYTRPEKLAIEGGSNGGLLVGAVMNQRPELFGAVVCRVPVADMLRYHLFTVGRFWIPEYGSSEDAEQFKFLYRYSPYHNVKEGVSFPATLVTTADTDDRVAPGMAKKFAARLQAATKGANPVLIRVETKAGHGGGKPVGKRIDEWADIYSFLLWQLGGETDSGSGR